MDDAIGGGGPFNVMDLTRGNLLNVHCLELMRDAPTGIPWFDPPAIFRVQANNPWHDRKNPGDPAHDERLKKIVLDRILAVLIGRTYFVADQELCDPMSLNWLTRTALGFRAGLLDLAEELGADRVHEICREYAAKNPGFDVPESIAGRRLTKFRRNVRVNIKDGIAVATIERPEVSDFLRAVGAAVDGYDDFDLIRERGGSGLDRLQAARKALFFVAGGDQDGEPHLGLSLRLMS